MDFGPVGENDIEDITGTINKIRLWINSSCIFIWFCHISFKHADIIIDI